MHEFDRDPSLDREELLGQVAEQALRINDKLLGRQGAQEVTTRFPSDTTAIQPAHPVASRSKARR